MYFFREDWEDWEDWEYWEYWEDWEYWEYWEDWEYWGLITAGTSSCIAADDIRSSVGIPLLPDHSDTVHIHRCSAE